MEVAVYRQLDELGRVVIPSGIRELLNWSTSDHLRITVAADGEGAVLIRADRRRCSLCQTDTESLQSFRKGYVCAECMAELRGTQ